MEKNKENNSSFSTSITTEFNKELLNIMNLTVEEVLNIDDIIEKMANYKNQSIFSK